MTQPDWDDERVETAFHARFDRPAPADLIGAVLGVISGTAPARAIGIRPAPAWAMAMAAVVLFVVGGAAVVGLGGLGRPSGGSSGPSGSAAAATPSAGATGGAIATPTAQALPGSVFGLQIVHVTDAIAVRDAHADNSELAVQGWFTPAISISCGAAPTAPLVSPEPTAALASQVPFECPDQSIWWLDEEAESLIHVTGDTSDASVPFSPAFNLDLNGIDTSWAPAPPVIGTSGDSTPIDVVLVGHFGDRRAVLCPVAEQDTCRNRFVVDSVAFVHGRPAPPGLVHLTDMPPVSSATDIEAVIANEAPQSPILSMAVVDGPVGLAQMEPSLANGQAGLNKRPVLWVARVLESSFISTYIVIDGTDAIYEMNPNNEAVSVGRSAAPSGPPPSAAPWPPAGATVVTLTSQVGAGAPPAQVAVVDESGRLSGATEKGAIDPATVPFEGRFGAYAEPGKPGRVHLEWIGGICDKQITVTVAADLKAITFDMGPIVDCDTIGIGRELVLDFSGSVDVGAITFVRATAEGTPAATERAYSLSCASISQDTCEQRAAGIVADYLNASPPKRVIAVRLSDDPCGSFTVDFDDGTSGGTIIDCFIPPSPR